MLAARVRLLSKQTVRQAAGVAGVSPARVTQAEGVLAHRPDLAEAVTTGTTPLNEAYAEAQETKARKDRAKTAE